MLTSYAGGRLFGTRHGVATPWIVALPGWARTRQDFDGVLRDRDAVALDLPGFGAAPEPPGAWGSPEYAEVVAAALDEIGRPVVVLGHSFGGRVGVHLAALRPTLVSGLVLTGAPLVRVGSGVQPAPGYRLGRWLHRRGVLSDARMEALRQKYGSADYARASAAMRGVHVKVVNEDYRSAIEKVACPVEMVWGDDDTAAPLAGAEALAALFGQRAKLTVLPGAGHLTPLTAPDALRDAVDRLKP